MAITGLDKAISMLTTKFVRIQNAVQDEIIRTGEAIKSDAASNAASIGFFDSNGNFVELNGKIQGTTFNSGNGYRIWVDAGAMGAYIEFGTGEYAAATVGNYDQEWRKLAYSFYVNGQGRLPARPYLYPAFIKNTTGLIDRLRTKIKVK